MTLDWMRTANRLSNWQEASVVVAGLGLWTAWTDQPTYLMVLVLLSMVLLRMAMVC